MTFEKYIESYLKEKFLNQVKDPLNPSYKPTEEDWNKIPEDGKKMMMGLFTENQILKTAFDLYNRKFPDLAFGTIMKGEIKKALI